MLHRIRQFVVAPVYDDEEKTRVAWLLHVLLLAILVGSAVITIITFFSMPERIGPIPYTLIMLILVLAHIALARKGYVRLAANLFCLSMWLLLTLTCLVGGGVMSVAFAGYLVIIIFAGLLSGRLASFLFAGLALLSGVVMLYLGNNGLLPTPRVPLTPQAVLIVYSIYFLIAAMLLYIASVSIAQALARARRGESDLAQRNRELQTEINERKRVDEELRARDTQLRLALEAAQMRVWRWDQQSGELRTSASSSTQESPNTASIITTYEEFLARLHPEDVEVIQEAIKIASETGDLYAAEYRMLQSDGTYTWFEAVGKAQSDETGTQQALVGVTHDISARKESEQGQLELALHKERVAFLTEFMGNMSHDLRTPLTVIKTSIYLMERLKDPEKIQQRLQVVNGQVDLVERYIDDILTISRLDTAPTLYLETVNFNQMVEEVERRLRPTAEKKHLDVRLELDADIPALQVDTKQIDHVLMNLIENAFNYTPEQGSVNICTAAADQLLTLEVRDTGIGIQEKDVPLIFDRFYRGENARLTHRSGTGLGLAIVKKIIEMHHGTIELESKVDTGTTFRVRMPIVPIPS